MRRLETIGVVVVLAVVGWLYLTPLLALGLLLGLGWLCVQAYDRWLWRFDRRRGGRWWEENKSLR